MWILIESSRKVSKVSPLGYLFYILKNKALDDIREAFSFFLFIIIKSFI